ncbi:MAG: hypothetical protein VX589_18380 [Myxococcota bacterium]|nr:hypothetical protein [Myxococcota bacterium]
MKLPLFHLGGVCLCLTLGCGENDDSTCSGAQITIQTPALTEMTDEPATPALNFGALFNLEEPCAAKDCDYSDRFVPERRTVFARSTCGTPLEITKVCIVDNAHDGDEADPAFQVPLLESDANLDSSTTVAPGKDFAIQLEYIANAVSQRENGDTSVLIIENNSTNQPVVAIPICAKVIALPEDGRPGTADAPPCELPSKYENLTASESPCP